jgi:hypothetical protein
LCAVEMCWREILIYTNEYFLAMILILKKGW